MSLDLNLLLQLISEIRAKYKSKTHTKRQEKCTLYKFFFLFFLGNATQMCPGPWKQVMIALHWNYKQMERVLNLFLCHCQGHK